MDQVKSECNSDSAAAKRAERRRQKILQNSEERMKRIFGGENYHDQHLKLVPAQCDNSSLQHETDVVPGLVTPAAAVDLNEKEELKTSFIATLKSSKTFWICLGVLVRVILQFDLIMDNALLPFILLFVSLMFLAHNSQNSEASNIEII